MPNAQGPGLCSTSVDKKDDHVCSMLVHVVCCNLIRVFFLIMLRLIFTLQARYQSMRTRSNCVQMVGV